MLIHMQNMGRHVFEMVRNRKYSEYSMLVFGGHFILMMSFRRAVNVL